MGEVVPRGGPRRETAGGSQGGGEHGTVDRDGREVEWRMGGGAARGTGDPPAPLSLARTAVALLAIDPMGLGGLCLRARASPAREAVVASLGAVPLPSRRLHPAMPVEALLGGPDPLASLAAGRLVRAPGILAEPALVVLAMAERVPPALAGALAAALDRQAACAVALDEGVEGEGLPPLLADRLALAVALDVAPSAGGVSSAGIAPEAVAAPAAGGGTGSRTGGDRSRAIPTTGAAPDGPFGGRAEAAAPARSGGGITARSPSGEGGRASSDRPPGVPGADPSLPDVALAPLGGGALAEARRRLPAVTAPDAAADDLARLAAALAIEGLRAPVLALRAAQAHAAWSGRAAVEAADLAMAAALVLAPRARAMPGAEDGPEDGAGEPPPTDDRGDEGRGGDADPGGGGKAPGAPDASREVLLAAVRAALPPGALAALEAGGRGGRGPSAGRGAGARRAGPRGRPLRSRPGRPSEGRVDAAATLRAAAPWQPARRAALAGARTRAPSAGGAAPAGPPALDRPAGKMDGDAPAPGSSPADRAREPQRASLGPRTDATPDRNDLPGLAGGGGTDPNGHDAVAASGGADRTRAAGASTSESIGGPIARGRAGGEVGGAVLPTPGVDAARAGEPDPGRAATARAPRGPAHAEDGGAWQAGAAAPRLLLRPSDIRIRRHEERSERLIVMAVDASGSAAAARLAEAKGAAERLLAGAYAARDHVALVTFRGTGAEVALPPTRSLARARRLLAGLPGGGGTPLAAGLRAAGLVMAAARARGQTPSLAVLTDGRANVALDGEASRGRASEEALAIARGMRGAGPAVVIDTASRPGRARALAEALGARWMPLPRSGGLPDAVRDALS